MNHARTMAATLFMVLLSGCSDSAPPPAPTPPPPSTGREETATIRNTEAIGVDGESIGKKVDAVLDTNDVRKAELDKALEGQ